MQFSVQRFAIRSWHPWFSFGLFFTVKCFLFCTSINHCLLLAYNIYVHIAERKTQLHDRLSSAWCKDSDVAYLSVCNLVLIIFLVQVGLSCLIYFSLYNSNPSGELLCSSLAIIAIPSMKGEWNLMVVKCTISTLLHLFYSFTMHLNCGTDHLWWVLLCTELRNATFLLTPSSLSPQQV